MNDLQPEHLNLDDREKDIEKVFFLRKLAATTFAVMKYPVYLMKEVVTFDPNPDADPSLSFHDHRLNYLKGEK